MSPYLAKYKIQHNIKLNKYRVMEQTEYNEVWTPAQIINGCTLVNDEYHTYEEAYNALTVYKRMSQEEYDRSLESNWVDVG